MASSSRYIIRDGIEGRERLRILAGVMQPATLELLRRAGLRSGMACLELGCGGGDVAFDMARIILPDGKIVATDIDAKKLTIARDEAREQGLDNIDFRLANLMDDDLEGTFDLVHARFLLTHLPKPDEALKRIRQAMRPGGIVVIEDIDFQGYFCHPNSPALWRYVELYTETVRRRGGDANIGPSLPSLLMAAGFSDVEANVVQPSATSGEVKLITPLTMENIADSAVQEGLVTSDEVSLLIAELYEYANTPGTIGCLPRVVQTWGRFISA